jgi:glutathione synthase
MSLPRSLLFITDPLHTFNLKKDSTYAMMRSAAAQNIAIYTCEVADLQWREGIVSATVQHIQLTDDPHQWFTVVTQQPQSLQAFSAVMMRKDPPFDMEYVYATFLLERAQQQGAYVINDPSAIRNHNEKLAITEFYDLGLSAPTLVSKHRDTLRAFYQQHDDVVVKPLDGMGGSSIFRLQPNDPNVSVILETMTQFDTRTVMMQQFIPAIHAGDKRILLIAGEVVPYCLARIPLAGESRGNLAAGGRGVAQPLSERDWHIARTLAPILWQRGLFLVGLDVIGDYLTEINVTSPTCFQEITQQTQWHVADFFVAKLLHTLEK